MDRNQIIGFVLIGAIMLGFFYITKPSKEEIEQQKYIQDSIYQAQLRHQQIVDSINNAEQQANNNTLVEIDSTIADATSDSLQNTLLFEKYDVFAPLVTGNQELITVKNNLFDIQITNKGARVYSVDLSKYKTYKRNKLVLFSGDSNKFDINFFANGKLINTNDLYFTSNKSEVDATSNKQSISLRANISEDKYLEYKYTIYPNSYKIDFDINFVNLDKIISSNTSYLELDWDEYLRCLERGEKWERDNTNLFYKLLGSSVEKMDAKDDFEEEEESSKIRWIGYKQQFFSSVLIAKNNFDFAKFSTKTMNESDTLNLKYFTSHITIPYTHSNNVNIQLAYYFGPNKFSTLRNLEINNERIGLEKMIFLGRNILGFINRNIVIPFFNFLGKYISNFGIIILIMTIMIKLILFPLTYKSYASSAKMRILKPEIDKATAKFTKKEDAMKKQQATMDLYKKAGVNPLGGCLPLLLQFPFLVALFRFFPASIELRQQSFLWVHDLSTYDAIVSWQASIPIINWIFGNHISLFTLLMAVTMIINTMLSNNNMDSSNPQAKSMKYVMYIMPLMMIVWFNNYSAGLSYYYFLSTTIGIFQILLIRKFINEDKVLKKLQANMKKNKTPKKSKFQRRLEEMQKQQKNTKR